MNSRSVRKQSSSIPRESSTLIIRNFRSRSQNYGFALIDMGIVQSRLDFINRSKVIRGGIDTAKSCSGRDFRVQKAIFFWENNIFPANALCKSVGRPRFCRGAAE